MNEKAPERECYAIADCVLDVDAAALHRAGQRLPLAGLTFDLFVCLARHAPAVVSHGTLLDEVWQDANVGEETLKQRVRLLRKSLGEDSKAPTFIETVRGKGYKLMPDVVRIPEIGSVGSQSTPAKLRWRWSYPMVAAGLILGVFLAWRWRPLPLPKRLSTVPDAVELYERGRTYYHRYLPKDNGMAIDLLKQAVVADPEFAQAYALLSRAYSQQPKLGNGDWGEAAKAAAETAIALAPDSAECYVALGVYYDVAGKPGKGIETYKKALERQPDHGNAWSNAACDYMILGRLAEAAAWNAKGLRLNPSGHFGKVQMGDILRLLGRPEEASGWLEKAVALQPDNIFASLSLSRLRMLRGDWNGAFILLEDRFKDSPNQALADFGVGLVHFFKGDLEAATPFFEASMDRGFHDGAFCLALIGQMKSEPGAKDRAGEVEAKIAKIVASGVHFPLNEVRLAALAAVDGREKEAMAWLTTACERGFTDVAWLKSDPALKSLQDRGDFRGLLGDLEARIAQMRAQLNQEDFNL